MNIYSRYRYFERPRAIGLWPDVVVFGPPGFNCWILFVPIFSCMSLLSYYLCFISFTILICMYKEMMHQYVRDLSCQPNIYATCSTLEFRMKWLLLNIFKPSSNFFTERSKVVPFCYFCFMFVFPCSIVITCWERANLLAFYVWCFVTFPYGVGCYT